jgi:UDP-4-amino-4,6-dideoxy-N-acetyl-beta-L-altrosamine transaminase
MNGRMIPYARQDIDDADIDAVVKVLRGNWITQGPTVPAFEKAVAGKCGARHAVAVNSATSALHIACLALNAGPGDVVWTTPNTFVASANCALYCGASVDFVDIDPLTWCMSSDALRDKLAQSRKNRRPLPKIVIPVHFGGQSCDMAAIAGLSAEYGFRVIEDASHAMGGRYGGEMVGSCRYSDITVFSFHPAKIITSGEGGMALTNSDEFAKRMSRLRSHGITRDADEMTDIADGAWYYQQIELGFNYRMTDIHAALGLSQLSRIESFVARRNVLAERYDSALTTPGVQLQVVPRNVLSARHLYVVRVPADKHNETFAALRGSGIGVNLHYIPVHLQPWYMRMGFRAGQFPQAERHYAEAISLPMFAGLTDEEQGRVVAAVREAIA